MYFKNLISYYITQPLSLNDEELQKLLEENAFRPCGSNDIATMGFCPPFERAGLSETMFHKVSGRYLFTLKKQERILPATVVNEELAEKIAQIETETGSPVGKKAKADLKQEIITKLLPQAFVKNTYTNAFLSHDFLTVGNVDTFYYIHKTKIEHFVSKFTSGEMAIAA